MEMTTIIVKGRRVNHDRNHGPCLGLLFGKTILATQNLIYNDRAKKKILFGQKCVFYACFEYDSSWEGGKNFRVGIIFE